METPGTYAGHTALCAAFEQGAGLAAERDAWRALALAQFQGPPRVTLHTIDLFTREDSKCAVYETLYGVLGATVLESAIPVLIRLQLIEVHIEGYRLTPFGAQVAAAVGKG